MFNSPLSSLFGAANPNQAESAISALATTEVIGPSIVSISFPDGSRIRATRSTFGSEDAIDILQSKVAAANQIITMLEHQVREIEYVQMGAALTEEQLRAVNFRLNAALDTLRKYGFGAEADVIFASNPPEATPVNEAPDGFTANAGLSDDTCPCPDCSARRESERAFKSETNGL